jgi:lipoprotein signal peptidase
LWLFGSVVVVDISSKLFAVHWAEEHLSWHILYNPGIAFSGFAQYSWAPYCFLALNIIVTTAILASLMWIVLPNLEKNLMTAPSDNVQKLRIKLGVLPLGLALIASGAWANALDRVINLVFGHQLYVTDFITYPNLFTGNLADIAIVAGALSVLCSTCITEVRSIATN